MWGPSLRNESWLDSDSTPSTHLIVALYILIYVISFQLVFRQLSLIVTLNSCNFDVPVGGDELEVFLLSLLIHSSPISEFFIVFHLSVCLFFMPILYYFDYYSFIIYLKSESMIPPAFSFSRLLWLFRVFCGSIQILVLFVLFLWKMALEFW